MPRLQNAPCGFLAFDDDRIIRETNQEAAQLLGFSPVELEGRDLNTLLAPGVRIFFFAYVYPQIVQQGRVDEIYVSLRHREGHELPVLLNVVRRSALEEALARGDKEPASARGGHLVSCVFLPIRRRSAFERELGRQESHLAPSARPSPLAEAQTLAAGLELNERMAALGLIAAGVAHEINNPLTYVQGNLDILTMSLGRRGASPELAEDLNAIAEAQLGARRIREIVGALRVLSRVDRNRSVDVDLAVAVDVAVRLVRHEVFMRGRLEVDCPSDAPHVIGDESRLSQVLVNLMLNAAQALPADSSERNLVRVSVGRPDATHAVLEVSDNGPGVPAELRERIFEPFFTTKPVGVGTGLGLAICHQIISSMGGTIELHTPSEGGASFRVILPVAPAWPDETPERPEERTEERPEKNDGAPRPVPTSVLTAG